MPVLFLLYAVTLLAVPSDVGLTTSVGVLSPSRVMLLLALAAAGVEAMRQPVARILPGRGIVACWILFLASALISNVLGAYGPTWSRYGSMVLEGVGVSWLAWWVARRSAFRIQMILVGATAAVGAVSTVFAVVGGHYVTLFGGGAGAEVRYGLVRQAASFDAPLFFAVWLVAACVLAIGIVVSTKGRLRVAAAVACVILAAAVITTASRFAMIATPLLLGLVLYAAHRRRPAVASVAAGMVIALVFITGPGGLSDSGGLGPVASPGVAVTAAPTDGPAASGGTGHQSAQPTEAPIPADQVALRGSTAARAEAIKVTISAVSERPLFGWGLMSARQVSLKYLDHTNFIDNTYLVTLIDTGIVGFAALVLLILAVLRSCLPVTSWLGVSRIVALLSLLAFGGFAAILAVTQVYALFWLTAGLAVGGAAADAESRRAVQPLA